MHAKPARKHVPDRAGLVGDDGFTHHGVFDYAYLRSIPNMTVMAPKDEDELRHMLKTAVGMNVLWLFVILVVAVWRCLSDSLHITYWQGRSAP